MEVLAADQVQSLTLVRWLHRCADLFISFWGECWFLLQIKTNSSTVTGWKVAVLFLLLFILWALCYFSVRSIRSTAAPASCRSRASCTSWTPTCWAGGFVRGSCPPEVSTDDLRRFVSFRLVNRRLSEGEAFNCAAVWLSSRTFATRGGSWRPWRSSAGSTGSTKPSWGGSFWPVRTRRRAALLTDQETW